MTIVTPSANNSPLVSRSAARGAFGSALSLYVGRGRRYSVKQLSNATGVKDRVIECAKCDPDSGDYREPELAAVLSIAAFLGPDFTTEWLRLSDQGAFTLPTIDDTPPGVRAADLADDAASVTRAAADGCFDDDKPALRVIAPRLIAAGHQLLARAAA